MVYSKPHSIDTLHLLSQSSRNSLICSLDLTALCAGHTISAFVHAGVEFRRLNCHYPQLPESAPRFRFISAGPSRMRGCAVHAVRLRRAPRGV